MNEDNYEERKTWKDSINLLNGKYFPATIQHKIHELRTNALNTNLINANELFDVEDALFVKWKMQSNYVLKYLMYDSKKSERSNRFVIFTVLTVICILIAAINFNVFEYVLGIRCFVPNNYLIWEATRPESDCRFCIGIEKPLILQNMSRDEFLVSFDKNTLFF